MSELQVTRLLQQWSEGDESAVHQLIPLVYAELRHIARRHMGGQKPGHTLQTTALIHEAYLRMAAESGKDWRDRAHFFCVAATAMRHVLIDHARGQNAAKRGAGQRHVTLDDHAVGDAGNMEEIIAVNDALNALEKLHARQAKVVELRFFGGLSVEETAEVLKISIETVMRDWRAAKAWLSGQLQRPRST